MLRLTTAGSSHATASGSTACTLAARNMTLSYGKTPVIDGLSFQFDGPGLLQVIGPNGSGKTTLLKALAGILESYYGELRVCGMRPVDASKARLIGYLPQFAAAQLSSIPITTMEVAMMDGFVGSARSALSKEDLEALASEALSALGVPRPYWNRRFSELSGGLKQRALLARAIIGDPPVLLLDEPLASVDPSGRFDIACIIKELSAKKTIVVTSHDPVLMLSWTRKMLVLGSGSYLYGDPGEVLDDKKLEAFYGSSVLRLDRHVHIYDAGCRP